MPSGNPHTSSETRVSKALLFDPAARLSWESSFVSSSDPLLGPGLGSFQCLFAHRTGDCSMAPILPPLNASCAYFKAFSFVCFVFLVRMEASGAATAFRLYFSNFLNLILSSAWQRVALSKCYKLIVK